MAKVTFGAPDPLETLGQFELKQFEEIGKAVESRKIEALKLYEPLPWQDEYHRCKAKEAITRKGNQVGGSLMGFVEVARAITGQDPYDKYPKENGVAVCLSYGEQHIGRVVHKYLFRAGAFSIIRDLETGEWRVFRPWPKDREVNGKCGDSGREAECKPAPPLIPNRFIDGKIAWKKRSENIFSYVKFTTGWELHALNSSGDPSQAQGFQTDLYHIDEDVATPGWYEEAIGRCSMRKGKIRWTAITQAKTDDMMNMIQRAEDEESKGVPEEERTTVCITATIYDNPYLPDETVKANEKLWKSQGEDVYQKRALGIVSLDSVLMYPTFSKEIHNAISWDREKSTLQEILTERRGEPPQDWCRYMVVDPGHTVCAVSFFAVPPSGIGDYVVLYDELYLRRCDKTMFGENVERKAKGYAFQEFIIDAHGGRLRELGSGILPKRQYEEELERRGVESINRGPRFLPGSDDIKGREEKLREWLGIRADGTPKFYVVCERCPNFVREIERFKKKTVRVAGQDVPTDEGNRRANTHAIETAEYAAGHGLPYVRPPVTAKKSSIVGRIKEARKKRAQQRAANKWTPGGSGLSLGPRGASA